MKMEKEYFCFPPLSLLSVTRTSATLFRWGLYLLQNKLNYYTQFRIEGNSFSKTLPPQLL